MSSPLRFKVGLIRLPYPRPLFHSPLDDVLRVAFHSSLLLRCRSGAKETVSSSYASRSIRFNCRRLPRSSCNRRGNNLADRSRHWWRPLCDWHWRCRREQHLVCRFERVELGAALASGAQCFVVSPGLVLKAATATNDAADRGRASWSHSWTFSTRNFTVSLVDAFAYRCVPCSPCSAVLRHRLRRGASKSRSATNAPSFLRHGLLDRFDQLTGLKGLAQKGNATGLERLLVACFLSFGCPNRGDSRRQAVGPAREANMYRARRQTMRGANKWFVALSTALVMRVDAPTAWAMAAMLLHSHTHVRPDLPLCAI